MTELPEDGEPTEAERAAVEQAWRRGELLPAPWVVVELPAGLSPSGVPIPSGRYVMLKAPEVWAARFADEVLKHGADLLTRESEKD